MAEEGEKPIAVFGNVARFNDGYRHLRSPLLGNVADDSILTGLISGI